MKSSESSSEEDGPTSARGRPSKSSNEAFWWAVREGKTDRCQELIKQSGVDVNRRVGGYQALHHAAMQGHSATVHLLIQRGAQIDAKTLDTGSTALHHASLRGYSDTVLTLVQNGADIDAQTSDTRRTPLMNALVRNHLTTAAILLQYGAALTPRDKSGDTALTYAHTDDLRQLVMGKVSPGFYISHHSGSPSAWQWSEDERRRLTESNCLRVLYIGDYMAGKTSLVRSITSEGSYLADIDDRTVIAELNHWIPDPKQKKTFSLVDLGGHQSYLSSGHYFHSNAPNNVATLCHDITTDKYYHSFVWVRSVLTRSPKCHIIAVLTKCDKLDEAKQNAKLQRFLVEMRGNLQREIDALKVSIIMARNNKLPRLQGFMDLRDKYQTLMDDLESLTFLISCKKGYEQTVLRLKVHYYHLSEQPENKVYLPKITHILFSKLGQNGVRIISGNDDKSNLKSQLDRSKSVPSPEVENETGNQDVKLSASAGLPGVENSASAGFLGEEKGEVALQDKQYVQLEEVQKIYRSILVSCRMSVENADEKVRSSLLCLHQHGLLMYFIGNPELEKIVFHNMTSFVSILRCVFHHDLLPSLLTFTDLPAELKVSAYQNREQLFSSDVKLLTTQGLLSQKLLTVLLHKGCCDIDASIVIRLLDTLEIGFSFIPQNMHTVHSFIPYFIDQEQELSESISKEIGEIKSCSEDMLSLHCQVQGNFPSTYWSYVVVHFCKLLHNTLQRKVIWKYGLLVSLGQCRAKLLLTYNGRDCVDLIIRARVTEVKGHNLLWRYIRMFSEENDNLMTNWWPGLVTSKVLLCTHCGLLSADPSAAGRVTRPHQWCLDTVLAGGGEVESLQCEHTQGEFPAGLVMPLSQDTDEASERLTDLRQYLQQVYTPHNQSSTDENGPGKENGDNFTKGGLEQQNQQKQLDELLQQQGTLVLRQLLIKRVTDKWGHTLEVLLQKNDDSLPSSRVSRARESFQKTLAESPNLRLFPDEKRKLSAVELQLFDITLLVKLLRHPVISGLTVEKATWDKIRKELASSNNSGDDSTNYKGEQKLAKAILTISEFRNEIHNKTDQSTPTIQDLTRKLDCLKSEITDLAEYVGMSAEEVFALRSDKTLLVYAEPLQKMQQAFQELTGKET